MKNPSTKQAWFLSSVLILLVLLFPCLCLAQGTVTNYVTVRTVFLVNDESGSADVSLMSCSYDKNGSPISLTRYGKDNQGNYPVKTDGLSYTYNGNQLKSISGSSWLYGGFNFKDYAGDALEYRYDGNGSMTADHNKGISSITYDSNGCPKSILIGDLDTNATVYVYSSDGKKLRTYHLMTTCGMDHQKREIVRNAIEQDDFDLTDSSIQPYMLSGTTTDNIGSFILENGTLKRYLFSNGYVSFSNGLSSFHYFIRDHLGSVRVVTNDNGDAEQVNNYYPFGGEFSAISTNTELQPYKLTGKEYDHRHGLDLFDFGARMYDPANLLWTSVDPLCEKAYDVNPYVYCHDNPVNTVDPDGRNSFKLVFKGGVRLVKSVARNGIKELGKATTYTNAFSDIVNDANTVFDSETSFMDKAGATFSLASEVLLPISINEAEKIFNTVKKVGRRSKTNTSTSKHKSINQLQKDVEKGKAPNEIERFDKGGKFTKEQDHVHIKDGTAINKDGALKHGKDINISNKTKKYLEQNGWHFDKKI